MGESSKRRKLDNLTGAVSGSETELSAVSRSLGLGCAVVQKDLSYPNCTITDDRLYATLCFFLPTMVCWSRDPEGGWITAKIVTDPDPSGASLTKALIHYHESVESEKKEDKIASFGSFANFLEYNPKAGDLVMHNDIHNLGEEWVFTKSENSSHRTSELGKTFGETFGDIQEQARLERGEGSYVLESVCARPLEEEQQDREGVAFIHQLELHFRCSTADEQGTKAKVTTDEDEK